MTVNILKSHMCTADQEIGIKSILAVMDTTWAVVKMRLEKNFRPLRDLNPRPLRYPCNALPTKLFLYVDS